MSDFQISATLKGGKDFDAPWLVIYGNTPEEVSAKLDAVIAGNLGDKVTEAAAVFRASEVGQRGGLGLTPVQDNTGTVTQGPWQGGAAAEVVPQQPSAPPAPPVQQPQAAGATFACPHGPRTRREGRSNKGPWVGHFCPLPKGDPAQCKPEWEDR